MIPIDVEFPRARVLACTATATPIVRDEILERLGLDAATPQVLRGFARPNLALRAQEVRSKHEREGALDAVIREALDKPGAQRGAVIVYAPTRKSTEGEAVAETAREFAVTKDETGRIHLDVGMLKKQRGD